MMVSPPVVHGDALNGRTLTSTEGQWAGTAPLTYSFAWLRCRPDCVPIDSAAGPSYTLTDADLGATVRSRVTATNVAGQSSESSAPTATVTDPAPLATPPQLVLVPVVSGDALSGGR